jgi:hypothetical protein
MEKVRSEIVFCAGIFMMMYSGECDKLSSAILFFMNGVGFVARSFYIDSKLS